MGGTGRVRQVLGRRQPSLLLTQRRQPLRGTRADLIVNIGWPDRRRELKVLMATYARTWRAQERSVSLQGVEGLAQPRPIHERGAHRARQPPLRSWLYPLWISDVAIAIRPSRGHHL